GSRQLFASVIRTITNNVCDVAICAQWLQVASRFPLERSFGYTFTCNNFLVHLPELRPDYMFLFQPLKLNLWLLTFLILILGSLLLSASTLITTEKNNVYGVYILCLTSVVRIFSMGSIKLPKSHRFSIRIILVILFL